MAFDEDLDVFFDTDDFAVAATLNGAAAGAVIFDRGYLEQVGIAGTQPVALAKASDYSAADVGKTLVIAGKGAFTIRGFEPQDDGGTVLLTLKLGS